MYTISIDKVRPGDQLAKPVTNEKGMVILPKGAGLTIFTVDSLRRRDIDEVTIEGHDPSAPPPKTTEEFLADLEIRFAGLEKNPVMMSIKSFARDHILAREKAVE